MVPNNPRSGDRNPYLRADSLEDLLSWHDADFVRCAFVTILGRQPDPDGETYYTDRVRRGHSKLELLWQLRKSNEGRGHDPGISGLDRTLKIASWRRVPGIGWFVRRFYAGEGTSRLDRNFRQVCNQLGVVRDEQDRQSAMLAAILEQSRRTSSHVGQMLNPRSEDMPPRDLSQLSGADFKVDAELSSRERYVLSIIDKSRAV